MWNIPVLRVFVALALGSVCLGAASPSTCCAQKATVQITQGTLAGAVDADGVSSFKGVPFAMPPNGVLRWKPPMPPVPWRGIRDATHWGNACMQVLRRDTLPWTREFMVQNADSEDCLYLNVWTPRLSTSAKLPVLVFIHGGGFNEGAAGIAVYDGAHLAKKGIVVVTINYRLGVFGFFAHPELTEESPDHSSGNYGLEDQLQALTWVRTNIHAFGGDPRHITIWGQSAGAASVGALLASPLSHGLLQGAIADSGLQHAKVAAGETLTQAEAEGVLFAKSKGAASLQQLRAMPAEELMRAPLPSGVHFRPVIDSWVLTQPVQTALEGDAVLLITGMQADDARTFSGSPRTVQEYRSRVATQYGPDADDVLKLYPAAADASAAAANSQLNQDRGRVAQWLFASRRSATHNAVTYTYYMDQAIPWPAHPEFGAFHTGELPYMFDNLTMLDRPWTAQDREVSAILSGYVVSFTRTGSPNRAGLPRWPDVSAAKQTMELGEHFAPMPLASPEREAFWLRFLTNAEPGTTR